jgi:glycosyltransferase involved in cell wall biosynthesis
MRVTYYQRRPAPGQFSIERVFDDVRHALPSDVASSISVCPFQGTSPIHLLSNILEARRRQGDINHITGDVHYLAAALEPRKTVLTIHDTISLTVRLGGLKKKMFRHFWYDMPIRRSRMVTVISRAAAAELCAQVPHAADKIRVIHDPVCPDFAFAPKRFNGRSPVILQVGTSRQNKNLGRVAEALRGIPCQLDIVGPLDDGQKLLLSSYGINYVNSWGLTNQELVAKYQRADMVIFASTFEGFGLPIVEAQATGRPVVTSNVCSMPEVAGDVACLVDPYDTTSIREGISRVIEDSHYRELLVEHGLVNVERFKASRIAMQYRNLYQEIYGAQ